MSYNTAAIHHLHLCQLSLVVSHTGNDNYVESVFFPTTRALWYRNISGFAYVFMAVGAWLGKYLTIVFKPSIALEINQKIRIKLFFRSSKWFRCTYALVSSLRLMFLLTEMHIRIISFEKWRRWLKRNILNVIGLNSWQNSGVYKSEVNQALSQMSK